MNVIYNLSDRDHRQFALAPDYPVHIVVEEMAAYTGRTDEGALFILVRANSRNVLLMNAPVDLQWPTGKQPAHPWAFQVESIEPLLIGAKCSVVNTLDVQLTYGWDRFNNEFIAVHKFDSGENFVFRKPYPGQGRVSPWCDWSSWPLKNRVGPAPGEPTGDP